MIRKIIIQSKKEGGKKLGKDKDAMGRKGGGGEQGQTKEERERRKREKQRGRNRKRDGERESSENIKIIYPPISSEQSYK